MTDFGISTVLVGHSERRHVVGEDDAILTAKTKVRGVLQHVHSVHIQGLGLDSLLPVLLALCCLYVLPGCIGGRHDRHLLRRRNTRRAPSWQGKQPGRQAVRQAAAVGACSTLSLTTATADDGGAPSASWGCS